MSILVLLKNCEDEEKEKHGEAGLYPSYLHSFLLILLHLQPQLELHFYLLSFNLIQSFSPHPTLTLQRSSNNLKNGYFNIKFSYLF